MGARARANFVQDACSRVYAPNAATLLMINYLRALRVIQSRDMVPHDWVRRPYLKVCPTVELAGISSRLECDGILYPRGAQVPLVWWDLFIMKLLTRLGRSTRQSRPSRGLPSFIYIHNIFS